MAVTYDKIATTTLSSTASTVTFSSISGSYTDLVLVMAGTATTNLTSQLRFNGSSTGYSFTYLNSSPASSGRSTSTNVVGLGEFYTGSSNIVAQINNYSNSTTYKTVLSRGNTPGSYTQAIVSLWQNTAAVTSIDILAQVGSGKTFASGCVFTLYGIKAA